MSSESEKIIGVLKRSNPGKVVDFNGASDQLFFLNLTHENLELTPELLGNTDLFSKWIEEQLLKNNARYAIGGYNEHRTIYSRSAHFDESSSEEPRRLHLGTDIWGPSGTPIFNVLDGVVFGFANNNNFGDYGATIIIQYKLEDKVFYILYGHLNAASLVGLHEGMEIKKGQKFAEFGVAAENGYWPPHLHFQIIINMQGNTTDFPGVCRYSLKNEYLDNCPDPMILLKGGFTN